MSKYYYNRYYANSSYSNFRNPKGYIEQSSVYREGKQYDSYYLPSGSWKRDLPLFNYSSQYPGFWDNGEGPYYSGNVLQNINFDNDWVLYSCSYDHTYVRRLTIRNYVYAPWTTFTEVISTQYCDYDTSYSQASYIDTVIAEHGTYPSNGYSGGYWYVIGAAYNPPTTPTTILVNDGAPIFEGTSFTVSCSTVANATSYIIERSINGGDYTVISTSTSSTSDMPLASWNTIVYRIKAVNTDGSSGYVTSATIKIQHFPQLKMRVGGVLKTSSDGWVRIDGVLKKIEKITVKANGTVKAV